MICIFTKRKPNNERNITKLFLLRRQKKSGDRLFKATIKKYK